MNKTCKSCSETKDDSLFRAGRHTCKVCEGKERYQRKKLKKQTDPEYLKKERAYDVQRKRKKEQTDPRANFIQIMRQNVRKSFKRKGYTKNAKTFDILGAEWEVVKSHFESLFKEGMTWDNYGLWEIDHIIPLATEQSNEGITKLCHYSNLQPLWKEENNSKSDKLVHTVLV